MELEAILAHNAKEKKELKKREKLATAVRQNTYEVRLHLIKEVML